MAQKEVSFYDYCKSCQFKELSGGEDPCDECLEHVSNENSHKPVNYKEKE